MHILTSGLWSHPKRHSSQSCISEKLLLEMSVASMQFALPQAEPYYVEKILVGVVISKHHSENLNASDVIMKKGGITYAIWRNGFPASRSFPLTNISRSDQSRFHEEGRMRSGHSSSRPAAPSLSPVCLAWPSRWTSASTKPEKPGVVATIPIKELI